MVSDLDKIYSCLARMRNAMVKAHPENLGGSVSDVLECALCLESFQKELLETVAIATSQARILEKKLAAKTRECEKMREALEDAEESLTSQHEEMVHFFENKCCPTEDEVVAAYNARQAAREALRPDSAGEGK